MLYGLILQWSGIITSWYSDIAGLQFKVQKSGDIRKHFEVLSDDRLNLSCSLLYGVQKCHALMGSIIDCVVCIIYGSIHTICFTIESY